MTCFSCGQKFFFLPFKEGSLDVMRFAVITSVLKQHGITVQLNMFNEGSCSLAHKERRQ